MEQRVVDIVQPNNSSGIQRVSNVSTIRLANNPTSQWVLQTTAHVHLQTSRGNTPGALPKIRQASIVPPTPSMVTPWQSNRLALQNTCIISQEAINQFLINNLYKDATHFIPLKMHSKPSACIDYKQIAMPMIHPTTGKSISSNKHLTNNPATVEVWMTAYGKDFGGMSQGKNKTGQKGTNTVFVMLPSHAPNIPKDREIMYARVVVNNCPQKEDANRI
jgi:hypothetical protein